MNEVCVRRVPLATGVTLNVATAGAGEPVILLHGFPESHRTWRHQLQDLAGEFHLIAPDQRGFGGSDKPPAVDAYRTETIVEDLLALADALRVDRFTLVGHDWGGAVAWLAALRHPDRIKRLAIFNAPHPLIFQHSLIENEAQRGASQYMNALRDPTMEAGIAAMGLERFFEKSFGAHIDLATIPDAERLAYIRDWEQPGALTAMLNWYRASNIVVPAVGGAAEPPAWTLALFPKITMPTLVGWGLQDKALLPVQLDGLDELIDDLRVAAEPEAGHFIPWQRPDFVSAAIREFIRDTPDAA